MKKILLAGLLFIGMVLSGCGSEKDDVVESHGKSIKGIVEIKDENGKVLVDTDDIDLVTSGTDDSEPYVELVLNENKKDAFFNATSENLGKTLGIYVNGTCISKPVVNCAIADGKVWITGFESEEQAKNIEKSIMTGKVIKTETEES